MVYGLLKPKAHFLVHYPNLIKKCGPPKYLWSLRFEAKHKDTKKYCNNINSRVNVPLTLCTKAGLHFAKFLVDYEKGIPDALELSNDHIIQPSADFNYMFARLNINIDNVVFYGKINFSGKVYKENTYVSILKDSLKLYKSLYFAKTFSNLFVLCYEVELLYFDDHFQAYEVGDLQDHILLKELNDFTSPPLYLIPINNGKVYLRNKVL